MSCGRERSPSEYCQLVRRLRRKFCWGMASTGYGVHTALTDTESDSDTCLPEVESGALPMIVRD